MYNLFPLDQNQTLKSAMEAPAQPHIAMFTTTGKGHLFPLIEFTRHLLRFRTFAVTIIVPDDGSSLQPQTDLLRTIPGVNLTVLPPVTLDDIPESEALEARIILSVIRSIPALLEVLTELKQSARLTAFIADSFGCFSMEAVKKLGIPVYAYHTSPAMLISFAFYLPVLDKSCTCEYRDLPEPVKLPGCPPIPGSDLVEPVQDRKSPAYKFVLEMADLLTRMDGILINTFLELEPHTFKALEEYRMPLYPVGPQIRAGSRTGIKAECLEWLDKQPFGSVLYVSFGSGGTLSSAQLKELALGLLMSEKRFLFVVRRPNDFVKSGAYFSGDVQNSDPGEYLPTDFMEKVKEKGFLVPQWAPQVEVLSHAAVGGFLTHCGWNSTLESIAAGVPLIALPLFAEQRMNAVVLSEELKVALRVREDENGVADREQIARLVRSLMEGQEGAEMRGRASMLKEAAEAAMGEDGSSVKVIEALAEKWK